MLWKGWGFSMVYIPEDWIKHKENTETIHGLLDRGTDIILNIPDSSYKSDEEIEKTLADIDEPYLLEHFKNGEINTDM